MTAGIKVSNQNLVIRLVRKMFFLVKKMKSLVAQQSNLRMLREEIVDRRATGLLHAGYGKADMVNVGSRKASGKGEGICATQPFFV